MVNNGIIETKDFSVDAIAEAIKKIELKPTLSDFLSRMKINKRSLPSLLKAIEDESIVLLYNGEVIKLYYKGKTVYIEKGCKKNNLLEYFLKKADLTKMKIMNEK